MVSFGLPITSVLVCLAQATTPPGPGAKRRPPPPTSSTATTFETVLAGKPTAGRNVEFSAILLPPSAIQTTSRGQVRHFVLAVKKASTYFQGLAEIAQELREQGMEKARALAATARDDTRFPALVGEINALLDRAAEQGTPRLAQVPVADAIVVEVFGLESLGKIYYWETVEDSRPAAPAVEVQKPPASVPTAPNAWTEAVARREFVNRSLLAPPDVTTALPDLPKGARFETDREVESFNLAAVLYNAELRRRRFYMAQRLEEDVRFHLERLERFLALEEQPLSATVTARVDIAADTYSRIHGSAPSTYVKERARGEASFVRRCFRTSSVLVTSYPRGARVVREGTELGTTPLVLRDVAVGSKPRLSLSLPAHKENIVEDVVTATPMGVLRVDRTLTAELTVPARPMTPEEASRIFSASFRPETKFVLSIFASNEQPGFKGKKDKDATRHAEALRKAAMAGGFFELSASTDRAEISLEIAPADTEQQGGSKDVRVFNTTYRSETDPESFSEVLSLKDEKAGIPRLLSRISERLKHRAWKRALGVE